MGNWEDFKEGFKRGYEKGKVYGMDREDRVALSWCFLMFAVLFGVMEKLMPYMGFEIASWFYALGVFVFTFAAVYHFWRWLKDFQ